MGADLLLAVEVVYARADEQMLVSLEVAPGTTVAKAIERSGLAARYDITDASVGIFGRRVERDTLLHDGDRVEIYRPLVADVKEARRRRAARQA
jgi:uncharacterized protein